MRTEVGVLLTGGLLLLAGCGGGTRVVTKTVSTSKPPPVSSTASTPTPTTATNTAPSAAARAAVGTFAAAALAANAEQTAAPVGGAIFVPAVVAAVGTLATAPTPTSTPGQPTTPGAVAPKVVAGHANGQYAVAYTSGTFHHPSQIVLNVSASPPQSGSVDWNVVCFETSGGIGRREGRETLQLPTTKTLPLPAPSNSCIASANVQLSGTGSVQISITG